MLNASQELGKWFPLRNFSQISHFPPGYKQERIAGLGLNDAELKANKVLTEYVVRDLNVDPTLPYEDNSFDVIVNAVSRSILSFSS
jgi:hypothetical protein